LKVYGGKIKGSDSRAVSKNKEEGNDYRKEKRGRKR